MRFRQYLWRALLLRCPSCGEPSLVRGILSVHDQCRACRLFFVHDEGTWLGAWHINFPLSAALAIVPAAIGVARGAWSTPFAIWYAVIASLLLPVLLYWHGYSLWIAAYYYCVPDDLRMGRDRPPLRLTSEEEAQLSPDERERIWMEEAVLDLEGDKRSRVGPDGPAQLASPVRQQGPGERRSPLP